MSVFPIKIFLFAGFFLALSCSNEIELGQKSGIYFLKDVEVDIQDLKAIEWKVGKKREVEISKGLQFKLDVPELTEQAAKLLYTKHGVDSWVYKVTKINRGSRQHLGYVAFDTRRSSRVTKTFTLHVYYHAASVSQDFRRFHCPAFGHRLTLLDYDLVQSNEKNRNEIYVRPTSAIRGNINRLSFAPLIFSGGGKLTGKYIVEIGLFNTKENKLYSNWTPLNAYVEVAGEGAKTVESCLGVKEESKPLPSSRAPRIEDFQIR
ncbi:MAG: hypothetical protein WD025_06385 [Bacteriovoracaceae bacterium]